MRANRITPHEPLASRIDRAYWKGVADGHKRAINDGLAMGFFFGVSAALTVTLAGRWLGWL